ncbi:MAG: citrate/2-methylcitrate synthase, partial [Planctomycetota bacterium]
MADFAKGLEGVVAAETEMSFIDGQKGVLEYVGIPIGDLADHSTFEETVFLLWNRRLPSKAELDAFSAELRQNYTLPDSLINRIGSLPKDAQPMHVLRTLVSALGMHDPDPNTIDVET